MQYYHHAGEYFTPIAYTLPGGLSSVDGSSSTGGCQPESCVMTPISDTVINGCDCPGNPPVNGTLIDGVIPSIDTTQQGWARELFTVNRNGQDSIMIGFDFLLEFYLRGIEIVLFYCPILGIGITGVKVFSSFSFPQFINPASSLLVTYNSPPSDNCQSLSIISFPIQPPMTASEIYFFEFLFTGGSSVHQLNWLHLAEIRFSDVEMITTTRSTTSSTISSEYSTTTSDGRIFTIHVTDESASGSGSLEPDDTLSNSMNITTSSEQLTTTLGSASINVSSIPITSIVGGLVGIIAVLLLLLIVGGIIMTCLIIRHRQNLYKLKPGSSLEHHYAVIENPNNGTAPSLELQNLSIPGREERRPSTAINDLYEPTTDLEMSDCANSNILSASDPGGDVIYSEIRDTPGMHDSGTQEMAQDTISIDLYDDDDDSIQENHYAIIPEMYMLATPINQEKLSVRPKSVDESLTVASHSNSCAGELQAQENEKSYSLVHKQPDECPPPVPEKSIELQQYLTVKVTAGTEVQDQQQDGGVQDQQQDGGEQSDENLDQMEYPQ